MQTREMELARQRVREETESHTEVANALTPAHELANQVLEAADKASPGPWTRPLGYNVLSPDGEDFTIVAEVDSKEDSAFIAMVRAAAPELALRLNRGHELVQRWRESAESERRHAERMDDATYRYGAAIYDGVARELAGALEARA